MFIDITVRYRRTYGSGFRNGHLQVIPSYVHRKIYIFNKVKDQIIDSSWGGMRTRDFIFASYNPIAPEGSFKYHYIKFNFRTKIETITEAKTFVQNA